MTIAALFLALPLFVQWTVDDNGPADYPSIAAAVAAVPAGATLYVEPGGYGPFTLDKRMSIIGATGGARPAISGESFIDGAPQVTLAGLDFFELRLQDVPGRATLTDCEIGHASVGGSGTQYTFFVESCGQVLVSNSALIGCLGDELTFAESPGAEVQASTVCFTECTISGGDGGHFGFGGGPPGQPGIEALEGSLVIVAGCTVTGGDGGSGIELCDAAGASALRLGDSVAYVRGTNADVLDGGHNCPSGDAFTIGGFNSTVTWSGVTLGTPTFSAGLNVNLAGNPEEPYLNITGSPAPGGVRVLNVYAQAFKPVLVLASLQPALQTVGKVTNGPLWFDAGNVLFQFPLTAAGQDSPAAVPFVLPLDTSLAGVVVTFQGFMPPAAPGTFLGTNPADLTLRF